MFVTKALSLLLTALGLSQAVASATPLGGPFAADYLGAGSNSDSAQQSAPWGNARPGQDIPDTKVTRYYEFNITKGNLAPDGVTRPLILINGGYIGPTIEANWGDDIQVIIHNGLSNPSEGTTIHWHGQPQKLYSSMDGVPSVSQCPIPPGGSFTYKFRAEAFGTGWYHAHVTAQYLDGLFGAMVIYGPKHEHYDIDLGPVIVQDYEHVQYGDYLKPLLSVPFSITPVTSNLINGKNPFNCSNAAAGQSCTSKGIGYSEFTFTPGKTHRLRIINAGGLLDQKFSIDGYNLTVIAQDYVPINPYSTPVVTVGTGQRTDVIVSVPLGSKDPVWMRSDLQQGILCGTPNTTEPNAKAIVRYNGAPGGSSSSLPKSKAFQYAQNFCMNDPLSKQVPYYPMKPPSTPGTVQYFNITEMTNSTGHIELAVNNVAFYADYNQAVLGLAHDGNYNYPTNWSVYDMGSNGSVRAILYNHFPNPHPMHLHGHNFWVLAEGNGTWDGHIVNPQNPARRDTHIMAPATVVDPTTITPSYLVLEWEQDNPGVWAFHCHFLLHNSVGLYVNILERKDDIKKTAGISEVVNESCQQWSAWTSRNFVDQTDSGT